MVSKPLTPIQLHADECNSYKNAVFVSGWTNVSGDGEAIVARLIIEGKSYPGVVHSQPREDLASLFGPNALDWGFQAVFVVPDWSTSYKAGHATLEVEGRNGIATVSRLGETVSLRSQDHRNTVSELFFDLVRQSQNRRVIEIGSRARSGIARREMFAGHEYVGIDILEGENVDVVGDAHELSKLVQGKFDFAFSVSVFEHLLMPWKVSTELAKVMNVGGHAMIATHQSWPIHDAPWDFWRFSKDAWAGLFNPSTGWEIVEAVQYEPAHVVRIVESGNPTFHYHDQRAYCGTACLARKIGEPKVDWETSLGEVLGTIYPE